MRSRYAVVAAQLAFLAIAAAGCASPGPSSRPVPAEGAPGPTPPGPANVNLRGFPVAFRQGYADGCESVRAGGRRRDEGRYRGDGDYKMGWNDGYSICRR